MKKYIQLALYCVALIGILDYQYSRTKVFGFVGYGALLIATMIQIITRVAQRKAEREEKNG